MDRDHSGVKGTLSPLGNCQGTFEAFSGHCQERTQLKSKRKTYTYTGGFNE